MMNIQIQCAGSVKFKNMSIYSLNTNFEKTAIFRFFLLLAL